MPAPKPARSRVRRRRSRRSRTGIPTYSFPIAGCRVTTAMCCCARVPRRSARYRPATTRSSRSRWSRWHFSRPSLAWYSPRRPSWTARVLHDERRISTTGGREMNWDRIAGNWKQMKGALKERWGKLTDDEFDQMGGKRDQLVGKIQDRYGCARDEAESQVREWENRQQ